MARASTELPDEVLVVAAILGDLEAFNELVLRYRAAVVRLAQAMVGREDAEDVAQDVFLLAFKALPSIENPAKFAAWVMTITRHRALRFSKQKRTCLFAPIELDEVLLERVPTLTPAAADKMEKSEEMQCALEKLPPIYSKDFWRKSACDIQDLGEFIRESVGIWARQRQQRKGGQTSEGNEQKKEAK